MDIIWMKSALHHGEIGILTWLSSLFKKSKTTTAVGWSSFYLYSQLFWYIVANSLIISYCLTRPNLELVKRGREQSVRIRRKGTC